MFSRVISGLEWCALVLLLINVSRGQEDVFAFKDEGLLAARQVPPVFSTTELPTALPTDVMTSTQVTTIPLPTGSSSPTIGQPLWDPSSLAVENNGPLSLQISLTGGNQSSDMLYGLMLEDIDHSIEGGLYAEQIQNRAFQNHTLDSWLPIGGASISLNYNNPLSTALTANLQIDMVARGYGFENTGYWGFSVETIPYAVSFYAHTTSAPSFTLNVSLLSAADGTVWASEQVTLTGTVWTQYTTTLRPSVAAPDENNVFVITSAETTISDTLQFQLISLFPPTYNNRINGVRPDIMNTLISLQPKYCRIPGGNNLEGESTESRWIWNNTIGPLQNRIGRLGTWGYYQTNGFGLMEWVEFCEDLGAELLLDVWAGYSLLVDSVAEADLQPYINEVLNEIEYLVGDSSTTYGAQRIADGRSTPVTLKYVEIGNEDFFSTTYGYRWPAYYSQLSAAYPSITFVATSVGNLTLPSGVLWDQHLYGDSNQFAGSFAAYDNFPRDNGTQLLVGEYSVQRFDDESGAPYPFMEGAVAESVYRIGLQRNSDVVISGMYAPYLANLHYDQEAKPRLIEFSSSPSSILLSVSYHALSMFSTTHPAGTTTLPVTSNIGFHPLYWVATTSTNPSSSAQKSIYVKLANYGANPQQVSLSVMESQGWKAGNATVLSGAQTAMNTPQNPEAIVPVPLVLVSDGSCGDGNGTAFEMPGWSVVVVTLVQDPSCSSTSTSTAASSSSSSPSSLSTTTISATVSTSSSSSSSSPPIISTTVPSTNTNTTTSSSSTLASASETETETRRLPTPEPLFAGTTTSPSNTFTATTTSTTTTGGTGTGTEGEGDSGDTGYTASYTGVPLYTGAASPLRNPFSWRVGQEDGGFVGLLSAILAVVGGVGVGVGMGMGLGLVLV